MTNNPSTPPPPMPANKRSALPWIFGGCGFLLLVCIVIAVVFFRSVSNVTLMNKQVVGPKTKSAPAAESDSKPRSAPATAPAGWVTYVNKRDDHPKLRAEFLPFSISYPSAWTKKDAPDAFFDVQKVGASSDDVLQEVSINPVSFTNAPESEYDGGLDKIAGFLKQVLSNLQMGAKESVTMDGATGRAAPFHGQVKGAKYSGRAILICPKGLVRGFFFLTLEKDSEAGTTEKILQQFRW
jgi:hypothetical protein